MVRTRTRAQRVEAQVHQRCRVLARDSRRAEVAGRASHHRMHQASVMERRATARLRLADNSDPAAERVVSNSVPELYNLAGQDIQHNFVAPQNGEIFSTLNPRGIGQLYTTDQLSRPCTIGGLDPRLTPQLAYVPLSMPVPMGICGRPISRQVVNPDVLTNGASVTAPAYQDQNKACRPGSDPPPCPPTYTQPDQCGTNTPVKRPSMLKMSHSAFFRHAGTRGNAAACWTGDNRPSSRHQLPPMMYGGPDHHQPASCPTSPTFGMQSSTDSCRPKLNSRKSTLNNPSNDQSRACSPAWVRLSSAHPQRRSSQVSPCFWTVPRDLIPLGARMERPSSKGPIPQSIIPVKSISGTFRSAVQPLHRLE
jgi:hypothetical protein